MLQKENRLKALKDFKEVGKKGKNIHSPVLNFKYLKNNLAASRFAVVVSLGISKKATKRNRVKRQVREVVRLLIRDNKIKPGFDGIFYAKNGILDKEYKELEKSVWFLLRRAGIIK